MKYARKKEGDRSLKAKDPSWMHTKDKKEVKNSEKILQKPSKLSKEIVSDIPKR